MGVVVVVVVVLGGGATVGVHDLLQQDLVVPVYPADLLVGEGHVLPPVVVATPHPPQVSVVRAGINGVDGDGWRPLGHLVVRGGLAGDGLARGLLPPCLLAAAPLLPPLLLLQLHHGLQEHRHV